MYGCVCMSVPVCVHACMCVCVHAYVCVRVCVCGGGDGGPDTAVFTSWLCVCVCEMYARVFGGGGGRG